MLGLAAATALGIAVGDYVASARWIGVVGAVAFVAAAFVFREKGVARALVAGAFVFAGMALIGNARVIPETRIRAIYDGGTIASGSPVEVMGTVVSGVERSPDGMFFILSADTIADGSEMRPATGNLRLFAVNDGPDDAAAYEELAIGYGTRVRVVCELKREEDFRNPGVRSRSAILDQQGIDATGTIKGPADVVVENAAPVSAIGAIHALRGAVIERSAELFSPATAGVLIASLLGNKHYLSQEIGEAFRVGGVFHILVISGLHITFIGGLAVLVVGLFTQSRWLRLGIALVFLWAFTLAVGADVPVIRAATMFTILAGGILLYRRSSLLNSLGTSCLILLAWRPEDLFSPSFQLTFASVAALVGIAVPVIERLRAIGEWMPDRSRPFPPNVPGWLAKFSERLYWVPERWEIASRRNVWSAGLFKSRSSFPRGSYVLRRSAAYLFEGIVVAAIVQVAMLPLVIHYFHRFTPGAVLLDIWVGVVLALMSFAAIAALLASTIAASFAMPFVLAAEAFRGLMLDLPVRIGAFTAIAPRIPIYPNAEFFLYAIYVTAILLVAAGVLIRDPFDLRRSRGGYLVSSWVALGSIVALIAGTIIVFHPASSPRPDGRLHVEFLDVGQGDSIFVTFPEGRTMLIDAGGRRKFGDDSYSPDVPSIGEFVVSEFLWSRGYSGIDLVVSTHADADHTEGLTAVAKNFAIGEAWIGVEDMSPEQVRLREILAAHNVPVRSVMRGERMSMDGVTIEVLNPSSGVPITTNENDLSVVLKLTYGVRRFLLTGDIETGVEGELRDADLAADVVKVPHHGSRTSSTDGLVRASAAQFAIVSVGRRSTFGHPHADVIDRWTAAGTRVFTTGQNGATSFSTDGTDLLAGTFAGGQEATFERSGQSP